jgi:uncharacterized coiled-coil DUF342 family protein
MSENIDEQIMLMNTYVKKQEEFSLDIIRKYIELSARFEIIENLKNIYETKSKELEISSEDLNNIVNDLQSSLVKNTEDHNSSITSLHEQYKQVSEMLTKRTSELNTVSMERDNYKSKYEVLKKDFDVTNNNYRLVVENLEKITKENDSKESETDDLSKNKSVNKVKQLVKN